MKVLRDCLRILAVLLAVFTVVAFFFPFAQVVTTGGAQADLPGVKIALGGDMSDELGSGAVLFKSGYFFGSFFLAIVTAIGMALGYFSKKKGWNGLALVTGIINAILLIVFIASRPSAYVDLGRIAGTASYTMWFTLAVCAGIAAVVICVLGILVKDALYVKEHGGLTIPKRIFKFLREYKSELGKVVWPTGKSVVNNTLVVLAVCAFALLLIWLVDMGLYELFKLVFGTGA